jgi:hypothetical protein
MRSMRRVLKCDGLIPAVMDPSGKFADVRPQDVAAMRAYVDANRTLATPFDIVAEGQISSMGQEQMRETLRAWSAAGATWWLESLWGVDQEQIEARVRRGPPQQV